MAPKKEKHKAVINSFNLLSVFSFDILSKINKERTAMKNDQKIFSLKYPLNFKSKGAITNVESTAKKNNLGIYFLKMLCLAR